MEARREGMEEGRAEEPRRPLRLVLSALLGSSRQRVCWSEDCLGQGCRNLPKEAPITLPFGLWPDGGFFVVLIIVSNRGQRTLDFRQYIY